MHLRQRWVPPLPAALQLRRAVTRADSRVPLRDLIGSTSRRTMTMGAFILRRETEGFVQRHRIGPHSPTSAGTRTNAGSGSSGSERNQSPSSDQALYDITTLHALQRSAVVPSANLRASNYTYPTRSTILPAQLCSLAWLNIVRTYVRRIYV